MEQMHGSRSRWGMARSVLDAMASAGMVAASIAVLWVVVQSQGQTTGRPAAALPAEPISIEGAPTLGRPSARVVIVEYSDFQCPYCSRFAQDTFPALKAKYLDTGRVKLAFRHLPLTNIHPRAFRAAEAAECAAQQGRFWEFHDSLFANPAQLEEGDLSRHAVEVGITIDTFETCMAGTARARVEADSASARSLRVTGTPSFLIGTLGADGRMQVSQLLSGAAPLEEFAKVVDPLLAGIVNAGD